MSEGKTQKKRARIGVDLSDAERQMLSAFRDAMERKVGVVISESYAVRMIVRRYVDTWTQELLKGAK